MTNYSVVSEKQQVKMSRTLSELMSGNALSLGKTNSSQVGGCSTEIPSASSGTEHHQQAMSLFTGAVIHGGQFSISFFQSQSIPEVGNPRSWGEVFSKEVQKAKRTVFRL